MPRRRSSKSQLSRVRPDGVEGVSRLQVLQHFLGLGFYNVWILIKLRSQPARPPAAMPVDDAEREQPESEALDWWDKYRGHNVEAKTPIDQACQDGWTVLMQASWVDMISLLLQHGANVDIQRPDGFTALATACEFGHLGAARALLAAGACIDLPNQDGNTPLVWAARGNHTALVQLLLDSHADVDAVNNEGWTVLMQASSEGHAYVISLLLKNGANRDTQHPNGFSALTIAGNISCGMWCMIDDVNKAGATPFTSAFTPMLLMSALLQLKEIQMSSELQQSLSSV
ncbi:hypothetical protein PF011_g20252 [Phytophthora fragariae]|uniref:Uncharacterized protein n=1 Tax=Phytophthora fragariae TaxID=53985 RepID=A0A6A3J0S9_9STRA|nr:hypothetical protein PF011_g20252 [Phytophthora fragariae]